MEKDQWERNSKGVLEFTFRIGGWVIVKKNQMRSVQGRMPARKSDCSLRR
jgi:hypothetical protein